MEINKVFHFILKREIDTNCEICIEEIKKDECVSFTECCNTYYHKKCLDSNEKCPHCREEFCRKEINKDIDLSYSRKYPSAREWNELRKMFGLEQLRYL